MCWSLSLSAHLSTLQRYGRTPSGSFFITVADRADYPGTYVFDSTLTVQILAALRDVLPNKGEVEGADAGPLQ